MLCWRSTEICPWNRPMHLLTLLLLALLLLPAVAPAGNVTLTLSCGAVGQELEICQAGAKRWEQESGHKVRVVPAPNSSSERLALYQQLLAAGAEEVDVFQIDVIWPGLLASELLDLSSYLPADEASAHFPAMIANNTVADRLVALPWFTDAGLLYYRKDLLAKYNLEPPSTWAELEAAARIVQARERAAGQKRLWGFVWQGRPYEGLTCDALEWVASHGGGSIVDVAGQVTINNPQAVAALVRAASWVGSISPPGVLNYQEEEARGVFQSGDALFMRNWPYAWPLLNGEGSPVAGKVGVMPLPQARGEVGRHAATLGGWQLAVSRHSRHPKEAVELVRFLTGSDEQKRRAIVGAYNPTRPKLYDDPEILAAQPFLGSLAGVFRGAVPRPSGVAGVHYNRVSHAFWTSVHRILSGQAAAATEVARLANRLQQDLARVQR